MKKLAALCSAILLLAACAGADGVSPTAMPVEFRIVSASPAPNATPSATGNGEQNRVVVAGTFVGDCSTGLSALGRRYGNDLLVVDLISEAGSRTCDLGTGRWAYQYESVISRVPAGTYRVEVLNNAGPHHVPSLTVTVR